MPKILLISGSPRKGNTDFILEKIHRALQKSSELILLKKQKINHCRGCLSCDKTNQCIQKDDMRSLLAKLRSTRVIVIGSPNYFDNVPGLLKDFIDRTNPFYETDILKGKKLINIIVGGGKIKNSQRVNQQALKYFADCHQLEIIASYFFKALHIGEIKDDLKTKNKIQSIIKKIKILQ